MTAYTTLLHPSTLNKAADYLAKLQSGSSAGGFLQKLLSGHALQAQPLSQFIEMLIQTKKPQIFAESSVVGDGSDWNQTELSILGDISIAVPVTVFDDGLHRNPVIHENPFDATLLFTPGALLRNGRGFTPADMDALQGQQMAQETARRRQIQLQKIDNALRRMETGDYGSCFKCGDEIDAARLNFDPASTRCIGCMYI